MDKDEILEKVKQWFRDVIATNHIKNTQKLVNSNEFNINPFMAAYLANFLTGNSSPESIARALVYPRCLGTSITTSFGQNVQSLTSILLEAYGSTTNGIDIEFIDQIDNQKKFCQLKAGPNTINNDDVDTIVNHFGSATRLARTNSVRVAVDDFVVGVLYGEPTDLSGHYKKITKKHNYPVFVGKDFWHRLTGDEDFYSDILTAFASVAEESDFSKELEDVIKVLAQDEKIISISKKIQEK
ncbi:PmeII family type II restriction endonuclease [Marinomonas gallaica]|uniref:PmeII family type II restriction endonuclease n=1 Tax=Marinomonas gallaica TaxID=1806667 RepID=UPI003A91E008